MKALSSSSLSAPKDIAPVFQEVGRVEVGVESISAVISELEDRLKAVLTSATPNIAGENSTDGEMCLLEARLSDLAETAFEQSFRINSIISRLRI